MNFKDRFYIILAGIFIASLITCNLIANKFVTVNLGFKVFIVSHVELLQVTSRSSPCTARGRGKRIP